MFTPGVVLVSGPGLSGLEVTGLGLPELVPELDGLGLSEPGPDGLGLDGPGLGLDGLGLGVDGLGLGLDGLGLGLGLAGPDGLAPGGLPQAVWLALVWPRPAGFAPAVPAVPGPAVPAAAGLALAAGAGLAVPALAAGPCWPGPG